MKWLLPIAGAALALVACGGGAGRLDADGDGVPAGEDCDDADVRTGAPFLVYVDLDGDGAGARGSTGYPACDVPPGMSAEGIDCDDAEPEVQGTWMYPDADRDGHGADQGGWACPGELGWLHDPGDCDDAEPAVNPAADEVCNGRDDDCDGLVDPDGGVADGRRYFTDADLDGWGGQAFRSCGSPKGHAAFGGDCDDADPLVSPSAEEVCNALDDDCDGNGNRPVPADAPWFYRDDDRDGWGDAGATLQSCSAGVWYAPRSGDCATDDPAVHPHAVEVCNGLDDDCDGLVDDADPDLAPWYPDADGDGSGPTAAAVRSCPPPHGAVLAGGDCDDLDPAFRPGGPDICGDGIDHDCSGTDCLVATVPEPALTWWWSEATALVPVGDLDGDGRPDFARVGEDEVTILGGQPGAVQPAFEILEAGAARGRVVPAGDRDADRYVDLWVLGPTGDVHLVHGGVSAPLGAAPPVVLGHGEPRDLDAIASADRDGDGEVELITSVLDDDGVPRLRIHDGSTSEARPLAHAKATVRPDGAEELSHLAVVGDLDGDGLPEIAWGFEDAAAGAGAVYLLSGPLSGEVRAGDVAHAWFGGPGTVLGAVLVGAGDTNGDGRDDLLAGDAYGQIDLYLDPMRAEGRWDADATVRHYAKDYRPTVLAGDFDGDGAIDLALGREDYVHVARGPIEGALVLGNDLSVYGGRYSYLGRALAAGDLSADGASELLLVSAQHEGTHRLSALYLFDPSAL